MSSKTQTVSAQKPDVIASNLAAERYQIDSAGEAALERLFKFTRRNSHEARRIADFLLGLHKPEVFAFDLTDFRLMHQERFMDCMAVLVMFKKGSGKEIRAFIVDGANKLEQLEQKVARQS